MSTRHEYRNRHAIDEYHQQALASLAYIVRTLELVRVLRFYAERGLLSGRVDPLYVPHASLPRTSEQGPADVDAAWASLLPATAVDRWRELDESSALSTHVLHSSGLAAASIELGNGALRVVEPTAHQAVIALGISLSDWTVQLGSNRSAVIECNTKYAFWRDEHNDNCDLIFLGTDPPSIDPSEFRSNILVEHRDAIRALPASDFVAPSCGPVAASSTEATAAPMDPLPWLQINEELDQVLVDGHPCVMSTDGIQLLAATREAFPDYVSASEYTGNPSRLFKKKFPGSL